MEPTAYRETSARMPTLAPIRLGSCSFTANGWVGSFYPSGSKPADFLGLYAQELNTVELDVTWYRVPTLQMIDSWRRRTPDDFVFAAKVPQTITHDKVLVDCDREINEFVRVMAGLDSKLGPLLLQFPFFNRDKMDGLSEFLRLLRPFLKAAPAGVRFAVEVRNRDWAAPPLLDLLAEYNIAFCWTDHSWMDPPERVLQRVDPVTADFTYLRWLGDREGIEQITQIWDKTVVDRSREIGTWAEICRKIRKRGVAVYGYVNNHYAGHAPDTIRALLDRLAPELRRPSPVDQAPRQQRLF